MTVPAFNPKNKEAIVLPLPSSLVAELRPYLPRRPKGSPVWPGGWFDNAAEMLRIDLEAAGVAELTDAGNAHFHSFRHTFTTKVARTTSNTKVGMSLTGHKSAAMFNHYTRADMGERAAVIENLDTAPAAPAAGPIDWRMLHNEYLRGVASGGRTVVIGDAICHGDGSLFVMPPTPGEEVFVFGHVCDVDDGPADVYTDEGVVTQNTHGCRNGGSTQVLGTKEEGVAQSVEQRTFNP